MKRRIWATPLVYHLHLSSGGWTGPGRQNTLFGAVPMITRTACRTVQNVGLRAVIRALDNHSAVLV